jgi:hypothetical protein
MVLRAASGLAWNLRRDNQVLAMDLLIAGDFEREPRLATYVGLIRVIATISHRALVITRQYNVSSDTDALLERLRPWCWASEERSYWPNTVLREPNAELVHEFLLSTEVIGAITSFVDGLYEWRAPLPEDLALLREDGSVVLFSTAHEEEGGLCLSSDEKKLVETRCPAIAELVSWRVPTTKEQEMRRAGR